MGVFKGILARRIIFSFTGLALVAFVVAIISSASVYFVNNTLVRVSARFEAATAGASIRSESLALINLIQRYTSPLPPTAEDRNTLLNRITGQKNQLDALAHKLAEATDPRDKAELDKIGQIQQAIQDFNLQADRVVTAFDSEGTYGLATDRETTKLTNENQQSLFLALDELQSLEAKLLRDAQNQARTLIRIVFGILGIITTATVIATMSLIREASSRVITPLIRLQEGVEQLRLGRLDQPVQVPHPEDELGVLADAFNTMAAQLGQKIQAELDARQAVQQLNAELEQRVAQRTLELEISHRELQAYGSSLADANVQLQAAVAQSERRAQLLKAASEVAGAAAMVRDPDAVLTHVVQLINKHFGFYHAGVFLLDDANEWAILHAANSEGGQKMLDNKHRLRVGEQGVVGWTAHTGQPRIALDVGADAMHFDNPLLPNTRSEMALPLKAGEIVLGVLDVQDVHEAAFSDEDVTVLQTLADQLVIVIENARLLKQTQSALAEAQEAYRRFTQREWSRYMETRGLKTQEYAVNPDLLTGDAPLPEVDLACAEGRVLAMHDLSTALVKDEAPLAAPDTSQGNGHDDALLTKDALLADNAILAPKSTQAKSALVAPIKLRDQVIGVLDLRETDQPRQWTADEITLVDAIANQVALAIENARLFEQTQVTLADTRDLYNASAQINAATTLDEILGVLREHTLLGQADVNLSVNMFDTPWVGDQMPQRVETVARYTTLPPEQLTSRYDMARFPAARLLRPDRPIVIADVENHPDLDDETRQLYAQTLQSRSTIFVPLVVGGQWIGFINGIWRQASTFAESDMQRMVALVGQATTAIQTRRLFEQAQVRVQQLAALNEISRAASGLLETERLLAMIYEQVQRLVKTDAFYVGLYDPDAQTVSYPLCYDEGQRYQEPTRKFRPGSNLYQAIVSGEPAIVQRTPEEVMEAYPGTVGSSRISATLIFVPMKIGDRVLGAMSVQSYEFNAYTPDDVNLLTSIANQVAVALENARLFEQTKQQIQDLETVNRVARTITSAMNLDQLLDSLYEQVCQICSVNNFYVATSVPEQGVISFLVYYEQGQIVEADPLPLGSGLTGHVINTNQPLLIHTREELELLGIKYSGVACNSYLAVPIRAGERLSGVIAVQDYERENVFDDRHLRLLSTIAPQAATAIENTRLFEQARRRALQIATAAETGKVASSLLNLEELLVSIADLVRIRFGFYHASVFLLDDAGEYAVLAESTGDVGRQLKERQHKLAVGGKSLIGWVTREGRSRVVTDTSTDAIHFKNELLPLTRSELGIPLKRGDRVIGALDVQSTEPGDFSADEVPVLELLADQVAIAIENARLYKAEQRRAVRQAALYEIGRQMTGTLDPQELARTTVEAVQRDLEFDQVLVMLVDEKTNDLGIAAVSTHAADAIPANYRQAIGAGMIGFAAQTGQTQLANDTQTHPAYIPIAGLNPRSKLCVPLKVGRRVVGVLDIEHNTPNAFNEEDIRALESLADQLAVALENARLYLAEQQRRREAAALLNVARVVGQSLEFEELMRKVAQMVAQTIGVDRCSIFLLDQTRTSMYPAAAQLASGQMDSKLQEKFKNLKPEPVDAVPLCQQAIRTGQPVVYNRQQHPTDLPWAWHDVLGIQSALVTALVSKGAPIGIMVLDQHEARLTEFTPEQVTLATAMAAQSAMVIDNARMYEELIQTADQLREMDRLKSQFLANMSHELRTPLNSIIGFSRVILKGIDGPLTDMQKQDLEAIHGSGTHLLSLINDILDISKIEAGKMELAFEEVDLHTVVKGVMSTAIGLTKDKPVNLVQKIPDDLPTVWADPVRTRQALLNLVSNASKFTEKGAITIEATADARFVRVSVRDTGIGIAAEKLDTIFQAFTQADASTTRKYGGTGLGLAIARSFIELHGGEIWVESELGVGTTFSFTLPRAKPAELPADATPEQEESVTSSKKVVVTIDDDPGVITLYRRYLEQHGYHVIGVSNSQQALEQVQRFKPHAITLDILMPQKDGWAVLQELKQNPSTRDIPVIMCSILSEQGKGFSLGASDYLVKPIMQDDLIATLKRLDGHTKTVVLAIDDRPEDILLIRRILEGQPQFVLVEAHSGAEGIEAVRRDPPDLILLDLMMPEMDGFAVLETLKGDAATRDIPVVVITAKELTEEDLQRLNGYVLSLLSKGRFNEKDLLNDIAGALARLTGRRPAGDPEAKE